MGSVDANVFFKSLKKMLARRLISPSAYKKIVDTYSFLPRSFCEGSLLLETRMHEKQWHFPDLSLGLNFPTEQLIADVFKLISLHYSWNVVYKLLMLWSKRECILSKKIRMIWLEFDIEGRQLIPSVFLSLFSFDTSHVDAILEMRDLFCQLQLCIGKSFLNADKLRAVDSCIERLPDGATCSQIGFMMSRKKSPIRLCIKNCYKQTVIGFLKSIGYCFDLTSFNDLFHVFESYASLCLAVDIHETVMNRLGFEIFLSIDERFSRQKNRLILEEFYAKKLCNKKVIEKCLNFINFEYIQKTGNPWLNCLNYPISDYLLINAINHYKICFTSANHIFAKSYFLVNYDPVMPYFYSSEVHSEFFSLKN